MPTAGALPRDRGPHALRRSFTRLAPIGIALALAGELEAGRRGDAGMLPSGPGVSNHPVGVTPSPGIDIPDGWPLGRDGSITCLTCHAALPSFRGEADPMLRDFDADSAAPEVFCIKCHNDRDARDAAAMHWSAVGVAHIKPERRTTRRSGGVLDSASRRCLSCHDGVNAVESQNDVGSGHGLRVSASVTTNHPVGIRYGARGAPGSTVALRPASVLPDEVRLPDGKVSCVSCHDLYARDRHLLSVPLDGSTLCYACHDMD